MWGAGTSQGGKPGCKQFLVKGKYENTKRVQLQCLSKLHPPDIGSTKFHKIRDSPQIPGFERNQSNQNCQSDVWSLLLASFVF